MTDATLELMTELFGPDQGREMYESAMARRERSAKVAALQAELEQTRIELGGEIQAAKAHLDETQETVNRMYFDWVAACNALEAAKIRVQQSRSRLRDAVQAILAEMKGPAPVPLVNNWQRPSWCRTPEAEAAERTLDGN
jgi:hypothetical protein